MSVLGEWENLRLIRDKKRKEKEDFMKSMIKVKISINASMLKKYMIEQNEEMNEVWKGEFAQYRKSVRGHEARYFLDYKRNLEHELANECVDKIIDELKEQDGNFWYEYNEFTEDNYSVPLLD